MGPPGWPRTRADAQSAPGLVGGLFVALWRSQRVVFGPGRDKGPASRGSSLKRRLRRRGLVSGVRSPYKGDVPLSPMRAVAHARPLIGLA